MVKIVTDSCSDLPAGIVKELGISVVPLNVYFGDEGFQDGVDITAEEFYERLIKGPILPKTTAPAPGIFVETYNQLAGDSDEIISIHISQKLSGTYNSALLAKQQAGKKARIEVIDSQMVSTAQGLLVLKAARAAKEGANLDQIVDLLKKAIPRTRLFFVLNTLEYLHKGGRLGKAQAFLGSLLNVKPLLHIQDGEVHPLERVRSRQKAVARVIELAKGYAPFEELALMYTTNPIEVEPLESELAKLAPKEHVYTARIGPTIGTYAGPEAVAVALIEKEK